MMVISHAYFHLLEIRLKMAFLLPEKNINEDIGNCYIPEDSTARLQRQ
jgi:hypothetical protein